jgi:error-prone DNA polymerase
MIRRTRPRDLHDLAVEVAIVRPGPIVGGAVNPYVRRREAERHAKERGLPYEPPVDHPLLREALDETLGVIIYQDQVLQVCRALAGFTAGQAEALRRAMSRRRSLELMESFWEEFLEGARTRDVSDATARRVFEQVVAFSQFGFPKSHAAAFGLLAYQSAWLRYYHPVEYYTALFNNQPMGFYSLDALGRDAARHGVDIRLPDVNCSNVYCTVEEGDLRIGLGFIRDCGWDVAEEVVAERERHGPYRSLGDLVRRAPPKLSRDAIENLAWVGGCDIFGLTRRELLWQVGLWLPPKAEQPNPARVRRQLELPLVHPYERLRFGGVSGDERLVAEYDVLGFSASGHPFSMMRDTLPPGVLRSDRLEDLEHEERVEVAGLVVARQRPETANGYTFILMEDEAGMVNAIVRPDIYERDRTAVRGEPFLWILGTLAKDDGTVNIIAEHVRPLKLRKSNGAHPERTPRGGYRRAKLIAALPSGSTPVSPYKFLKQLRQNAPPAKSWG